MLEASTEELGELLEGSGLILRQPVFYIPPEALDGIEFGCVRGEEHEAEIGREP